MDNTYLTAPNSKRIGAIIIDLLIVFFLWYLLTIKDLEKVTELLKVLDPNEAGANDIFAKAIFQMVVAFVLKMVFCQTLYFCLLPALIGRGKTLGKLIFGLSMVDSVTLKEISVGKLILREFVCRALIENLFIIPAIVSAIMALSTTKAIHDKIAGTVVVSDTTFIYED